MKKFSHIFIFCCLLLNSHLSGQVGIGTNLPDSSAILELQSTDKGLLLPRLTTSQIFYINNPSAGLIVFNNDSLDLWFFDGFNWMGVNDQLDTLNPSSWLCGIDIIYEGHYYKTVKINSQCWLKENLNVGEFMNCSTNQTNNGLIDKYCYNNDTNNCSTLGGLYQWNEIMQYSTTEGIQGICPVGWHIPTQTEWCILNEYLDITADCDETGWIGTDVGHKLRSTTGWCVLGNGTNSSGFTALPGGYCYNGTFEQLCYRTFFWSSSQYEETRAWSRRLASGSGSIENFYNYKIFAASVRCLKN